MLSKVPIADHGLRVLQRWTHKHASSGIVQEVHMNCNGLKKGVCEHGVMEGRAEKVPGEGKLTDGRTPAEGRVVKGRCRNRAPHLRIHQVSAGSGVWAPGVSRNGSRYKGPSFKKRIRLPLSTSDSVYFLEKL